MSFYSNDEVKKMGFKKVGINVKISTKCSIYNPERITLGDNSRVDDFCLLSGEIVIGRNVHIAAFCNVAGGELGITFCDYSGLAYGCHVFTQSDDYSGKAMTNPTVPEEFKNVAHKEIRIGKHVIVGTSSIILPGSHLAEGCSVGAMSMVTKPTESWYIYMGVPARKVKRRSQNILEAEKKYLREE